MRHRLCKYCGGWHNVEAWPGNCLPPMPARSRLAAPTVIADTMDPVRSNLDGKMYDSKRRLRQTYREGGVTEMGNDVELNKRQIVDVKEKKRKQREEVRASIDRALTKAGIGKFATIKVKNTGKLRA